ncbi:MAG: 23S rRNA (uracil(1939)-C(5))-methyltransferase RlmD [Clostridiales bacterium]|nr:23S rRNA (uracil(1939)-C(5))-methyltransferase RlmD [Clostridiales bacterium]
MKKGDLCEAVIERIEFPDKGIARIGEDQVVVKHAIPGQRVRFVINKKRHGKMESRLLEILERSPLEQMEGVCPHFGQCGGCQYQSLPYEEQLRIKEAQVKGLIDGVCDPSSYEFEGIMGSPLHEGYRNKMEFSFGDEYKDGPLALGMHKRGSFYDIVTTTECRIVHPDFCRILEATLAYFQEKGVSYYRKLRHEGYLRHLLVRRAVKTGEILVALVTSGQTGELEKTAGDRSLDETAVTGCCDAEKELLAGWLEKLLALSLDGAFAGILHIRNDSLADVVQSDETTILYGQDYFYEELLGLRFRITPFSFFQTNSAGAEVLYETARSYVGDTKDKIVFDLYCGTGTIAQVIAPVAAKVIGVEIVEEAVEAAKENAAGNGLDNCEFIAGDVGKVIDEIADRPDLIILDPPRDGIHPKALDKIIQYGADRLVYISCKPTSLARDLITLQAKGYRAEKIRCVDMFPCTSGIETIVQLSKGEINSKKVRVEFSLEDMDMSGFQKGATYG